MGNQYQAKAAERQRGWRKAGIIMLAVLGASFVNPAKAQVSSYTFSSSSGTYTPISGGTVLGVPNNDDTSFPNNPIGFSFCYNGATYTTFGVNSNGWIEMGSNAMNNSYTTLSTGLDNNVISAFNYDIQGDATTGELRYQTIGVAPNRTLVVQWKDYDRYQSVLNNDVYNFQIRLNESGTIDVVYGAYTSTQLNLAQVGLRGASSADFNNVSVSNGINTWATPVAGITNGSTCEHNTGLAPASGQTYTWTQPTAPAVPISATFTGVTTTAMTLNWVDNSTNEANFIVQRSLDNITFTTVATIPSTSIATTGTGYLYNATNLYNATLYYWRVFAANANCGGSFLAAQQSTLPGTMCGTYTVGPTGAYTSLTAAFAAVATNGVSCPLVFDLQAAYVSSVETFPISIPYLGNGPTSTITVRPELVATNLSITSGASQTIIFNGAQYINFDGRPGSTGTVRHLTIENTSTTGNAAQFINDGAYNGFNYCIIRGVNTSATSGVVLFGNAATGGIGNSNNVISNSELRDGATTPANLVYALNSTANVFNTNNSFTNNIFHDWFSASAVNSAITASTGNTAWVISNNSFYQTATRTFTTANTNFIVNMNSGSGSNTGNYNISGNYFGGTAALCGGTAYTTAGAIGHRFIAVQTNTGIGGTNSIQGNTFRNFNVSTTASTTTANGIWCAINTIGTSASNNIGNITPNVIGSNTANNQIVTSSTLSGGLLVAINNSASGTQNISNNQIGGLTANTSAITVSSSIVGIQTTSGAATTISGNIIGSTTLNSSLINAASTSATGGQVTGILCSAFNSALPGNQITNNTIMNLTNQYAGTSTAGFVRGIATTSGINTISSNTIANLSNMSPQTGTTTASSVIGISQGSTSSGANQTVSLNTITNLANLSLSGNVNVNAIVLTGTTANRTLAFRNSIIGIGAASSGAAVLNGINIIGGTCRVYNNFVNIGVDATGASLTLSHEFNGILKNVTNQASVLFNSVRVGGTGVGAGAANSYAFRRVSNPAATPADSVFSNIFVNERSNGASTGAHYSAGLNNNTNYVCDGNVYYGAGTGYQTGIIGTTSYATISLWLAGVPGQDMNSFQVNPNFISTTNLHINNSLVSVLESRAQNVGNITNDIDGQNRPGPTGSVNGGGTIHDIGADEFDGIPVNVDIGIQSLTLPLTTGCHGNCEQVRVRIRNFTPSTLNMAANPVTINASTTGPNPQTFAVLTISSGTIGPNGFLDTTVAACYDMTAAGTHTFIASASTGLDFITSNNTMTPVAVVIGGGTATVSPNPICLGATTTLTVTGQTNGGTIQWQSSPDNITWTNISGATTTPYVITPTDTTFYRILSCGLHASTSDTIRTIFVTPPTTVGDTVCGLGTVNLSASGTGTLNWYTQPTGGTIVNSGPTYSPTVSSTTNYYVSASSGTPPSIHTTTFAAGNGSNGNMFTITAINTVTITKFDGHVTSGTSDWRIDYRPDNYLLVPGANTSSVGWIPLGTATAVPAGGTGLPTNIPITFAVTIPAGQTYSFHVMTTAGSTVQYTNGTTVGNVYNANPDFQFREGHGGLSFNCTNVPRVFNGRIHYQAGCESNTRTIVTAMVTTPPAITLANSAPSVCDSGLVALTVTSPNTGYAYTWNNNPTLDGLSGDSVNAFLTLATGQQTYIVNALDAGTGCFIADTVSIGVNPTPVITASAVFDTLCAGSPDTLSVAPAFVNPVIVGTPNVTPNTNTSYPAPYGNFYWGSRHQMLITAADLAAAGLTAGLINGLSFELTATGTNGTQPLDNFEIKLALSGLTSLTAIQTVPMTSVYFNASYVPVNLVNTHMFSTPFYWDGVSSILVETCHNNSSFIANCSFRQTSTSYSSTVYYRADASGVCGVTTLTGSNFQRPVMRFHRSAGWDYSWTPGAGLSDSTVANPTFNPTATTMYYVTATDTMTGCTKMDSVLVTVNPLPPVDLRDTVLCSSNMPFTAMAPVGGYNYLWSDSSTASTLVLTGNDTVNVLVTDSVTGCFAADSMTIAVNASPVFTLANDTAICNNNAPFVAVPNISGNYAYLWSDNSTNSSLNITTTGNYWLTITDTANGCNHVDSINIAVNPNPVFTLGNDSTLCSVNAPVVLNGPSGTNDYLWSDNSTGSSLAVSTTGTVSLTVTDSITGCAWMDTISITVNPNPTFTLGADTTLCSNNAPVVLNGPSGTNDYLWSDNSTGSSLAVSTTSTVSLTVTDSITGCAWMDTINVNINPNPVFSLGADTTLCGTGLVINGPAGSYNYLWNDNSTAGSYNATGGDSIVTLMVTDSLTGCAGMDSMTVNINPIPVVLFELADDTVCVDDGSLTLNATPAGGTFSGSTGIIGSTFSPATAGVGTHYITYTYTDGNGCSASTTDTIWVNACVGFNELAIAGDVTVYPNPNDGAFTLNINNADFLEMNIQLINIEGKVVYSDMFSNVTGTFSKQFDLTEFANGVYYVRITTDKATAVKRIVKNK